MTSNSVNPALTWRRTGKITLRAEHYLIIRLINNPPYLALYGPQCAREAIGRCPTVESAKAACEAHRESLQEKAPTE